MVRPQGKLVRDCDVRSRDLSFRSVWRELKAQGWTNKKPRAHSLDDRYRYVRPGCDPDGAEGVDFFLGETAVLEYYANMLRTRARTPRPTSPGDAEIARAAQVVRETYGALIDGTGECSDDGAGSVRPPLSSDVAPVPRNNSPSTPPVTPERSHRGPRTARRSLVTTESPMASTPSRRRSEALIATSPHVRDGSVESVDEDLRSDEELPPENVSVESAEDESEYAPDASEGEDAEDDALGSELLVDKEDTLNDIGDGDEMAEYGAMESGDDAEQDDLEEGDASDEDCTDTFEPADDDDPEATETEIAAEVLFAERFLDSFGGADQVLAGNLKNAVLREMSATGWEDVEEPNTTEYMMLPYEPVDNTRSYMGLRQGYSGPTAEALRNADSPLALFFFFMPVALWQHIAVCSNQYGREMTPLRVDERYKRYSNKQRLNRELPKKTKRDIQTELEGVKPIQPHELCRFIGLLIARTIAPNREKLAHHWKTTEEGAIPRGAFGSVLRRDRFMAISRNLHFNPNGDPRAATDRAWKIRKVVDVLQRTFERGYVPPSHLAFDEAMLPSRSSFNKMRVYMKDKPHKWGTKLFMLCSAVTAYCIRFEVYCGKKEHSSDAHTTDMKSGPAAVVRNLLAVFGPDARKQGMRLVVVDRFYTSVALAIQLLLMGFYCVGTIMTNRLGYCKGVIEKKKSRPASIARGSFKCAKSKLVPNMAAISWWDSRPVHFLCTGGSLELDRVVRQDRANQVEVPCPRVVKDYHAFMGGVDVHDQLRLQRYSIQRAVRFRKYYKSLVLGLIDLAIVNGYIVHKAYHKHKSSRPLSHVKYMKKLHLQLCQLRATDMYEGNTFGTEQALTPATPVAASVESCRTMHPPRQVDEWRNTTTQPKRRQRACKVCSLLRVGDERAKTTAFFCGECSESGPIFLCMKPRRQIRGVAMTCWDVWHREWMNGKLVPVETGRSIRVRRAAESIAGAPSTPGTPVEPLTPLAPASRTKRRRTAN